MYNNYIILINGQNNNFQIYVFILNLENIFVSLGTNCKSQIYILISILKSKNVLFDMYCECKKCKK